MMRLLQLKVTSLSIFILFCVIISSCGRKEYSKEEIEFFFEEYDKKYSERIDSIISIISFYLDSSKYDTELFRLENRYRGDAVILYGRYPNTLVGGNQFWKELDNSTFLRYKSQLIRSNINSIYFNEKYKVSEVQLQKFFSSSLNIKFLITDQLIFEKYISNKRSSIAWTSRISEKSWLIAYK